MAIRDYRLIRQKHSCTDYLERQGVRVGNDRKYKCILHDDHDPSASIFTHKDGTERWRCHVCDLGGDIVDLVKAHRGVDDAGAIEIITGESQSEPPPRAAKPKLSIVRDYGLVPDHAPVPVPGRVKLLSVKGKPYHVEVDHVFPYRNVQGELTGYVLRIDAKDGEDKRIMPIRWHLTLDAFLQAGWSKGEALPLYGEERLKLQPDAPVLMVSGEKVVDLVQAVLPDWVVLTWQGGDKSLEKQSFERLKGRRVILWPDNDESGITAMKQAGTAMTASTVMWLTPDEAWPPKYDAEDVLRTDGFASVEAHLRTAKRFKPDPSPKGMMGRWERESDGGWLPDVIILKKALNGVVKIGDPVNAFNAILFHPRFQTLAFDVLTHELIFEDKPIQPVTMRNINALLYEATGLDILPETLNPIIEEIAMMRPVNRLAARIKATPWDGVSRVGRIGAYLGVELDAWGLVGPRTWFLAHVNRILNIGAQADLMLVLEGEQGIGKTSALRILGNAFGHEGYMALSGVGEAKAGDNAMMILAGKTLVELAEMVAHRKADQDHFRDFLTRTHDRYRLLYRNKVVDVPRSVSFAGTTNRVDPYWTDSTGGRRLVPVEVTGEILLDALLADREQLYAEAATMLENGAKPFFERDELALQTTEVEARTATSMIQMRLTEAVETWKSDFLTIGAVWGAIELGSDNAAMTRQRLEPEVIRIMAEMGFKLGRWTVDGQRVTGFKRGNTGRGRRWNKRKLDPRD